jgi:hypothetical protein
MQGNNGEIISLILFLKNYVPEKLQMGRQLFTPADFVCA